jgi:glucosylceramidase
MRARSPTSRGTRPRRPLPSRRLVLIDVVVVALVSVGALVALSGDERRSAPLASVRSWVTTPDERQLLAAQAPLAFSERNPTSSAATSTIDVDPTQEYQRIDGFGASITDSSAAVLYRLDSRTRDATMVQLFSPREGAGLSYLRQPMGASDFVDEKPYTYDDIPPGASDYAMEHFSAEHDERQILPLLRRAKALNPQLEIIASPWSAPAWMKTTRTLIGGSLTDDARIYEAYALYFVKFLQAYASAGVPVDAVTVQNEPQFAPSDYPGMLMSPSQEATFISVLGPTLRSAGLRTSILAYDHNWAAQTGDGTVSAGAYAEQILSDAGAAPWVGGVAFHCYEGRADVQGQVHRSDPDAEIVLSECSGSRRAGETPGATFARSLDKFSRLVIQSTRNWAGAVLTWNVALGPNGGPHRGGCTTCTGLVTVGAGDTVAFNAEYYALASVSRVVRPAAVRIASTSFAAAGENSGLATAAYRNPDASISLVAYNQAAVPRRFTVRVGNQSFSASLPGGGLGSYSWPGAATQAADLVPVAPSEMTATASPEAPVNPCCTGDTAARAVDDNAGTRWSTGHAQRPGDHLQVDLGQRQQVARVVLDAGAAIADAPRRWALYASDDPGTFGRPVAEGSGQEKLTRIDLTGVRARYLRVVTTAQASTWWSVAELRVYVPH